MRKIILIFLSIFICSVSFANNETDIWIDGVQLGSDPYSPGGDDVALADGGTGASLADPNADRIMFWDDSTGSTDWLTVGSGLSISGTTLTATATASGWTDAGSGTVDLVTTTDTVNIGSDLGGRLNIDGSADEVQLWIQGHSTQTSNLLLAEASDGTDRLSLSGAGVLTVTGSGSGSLAIGNGSAGSGVLQINEDTDAGSNYASFQVPSLSANTVYTLPSDDGASGEILQTDGSGTLDWATLTDTKCIFWENPVAGDDFKSVFVNDSGSTMTVTKLWCESDQTVNMMFQVDDGTPADMDGTDLACVSTPDTDTSLDGDATIASGDRVDIDVASVSGTPTWVSACFTYQKVN